MKKTFHISILDFNLFPQTKDFYSEFYLMNNKPFDIYTDKIGIRVLAKQDKTMETVMPTLRKLSNDKEFLLLCEAREKYYCDRTTLYEGGKREGIKKGEENGKREVVRNLHKNGYSPEEISTMTAIPRKIVWKYLK
ncbi:MAG: hypothetical protein OSJ44_14240 [Lachnospiraceae bacterium]|nr:hypothetical protein [Lachnospiraceae bacterium]